MNDEEPYRIDKTAVRTAFDRAAHSYDESAVVQKEIGDRLIERMGAAHRIPACILDLGAGTGLVTERLRKQFRKSRVTALDLSLQMLKHARRRDGWLRRSRYICGDIESLPLLDDTCDAVFSNLALQWCNAPGLFFRELRRVVRPGGAVWFSTFGPDTLKEVRKCWSGLDTHAHVNHFIDMHDLGDAMLAEGLGDPVMETERLTVTYHDVRTILEDLKHLGAHNSLAGRPRGLTPPSIMRKFMGNYEALRSHGKLPVTYEVIYGHAWLAEKKTSVAVEFLRQ